ncbi:MULTISPECIES: class I SAM-dependent methyltransferase [Actinoplanes]|uniref:class I SAM-dependent methyltransferase n=1 Tax=Actinoplanes TaxID=1865 RepID=UPI0006970AE6|nr:MULTISPECIES: class I SAM-dependent methyltransferase [Actinoplanes]GLY02738.1 methyltransferase [Actinoplanes sp. NBRC 101535]
MTSTARYDEAADLYIAEVGEKVTDGGTAGLLDLAGQVDGLDILDVACGHGRITRELARRGARPTGVDLSATLVERARKQEAAEPLGIEYHVGDAAEVVGSFDMVVCNFGLSDIDDLDGMLDGTVGALRPGGALVFSILHPCFPGWGSGRSSSWAPQTGYHTEGWWRSEAASSKIRQAVGANHRTLSTYLNALVDHGLIVDRLAEPLPPPHWLDADPARGTVPIFLVVRARRPRP